MKYTYDVILHNAEEMPISRACRIANMIQEHIDGDGRDSHVQSVGIDENPKNIRITIETSFKLDDLFSAIYDNRVKLGYKDFSIYYTEDWNRVASMGYGRS